ncbi:DUF11 domain-containing protein [Micromonospora sp. RHAY321]|uniref:DUF11 domain-containing protein n=1 Tax=Micromonospora sp. RHAY321 TaxID=2944807 RepID=UPI00207C854D|nr:DUF11 domain-containing protein [Micromonospora sp. RHAY321]MCO1596835.1 DUF11 domain-containing protein [Micromonospora sp. RHAY321]
MSSTSHPRRRFAQALSLGLLVSLVTAVLPASPALAAPSRADLTVTATGVAPRDQVVDVGGGVTVEVEVRNIGRNRVEDVTLTYGLPAGAYFTDGNWPPEGWQCDFVAGTCTYGTLAAGASAPKLRFDFSFPPAPAGTTAAVTATATTTSSELSTANNVGEATIAYVRGVTDLEVTAVQANPAEAIVGDTVNISVQVGNAGNMAARDIHVTVPLPDGFARVGEPYNYPWHCTFGTDPASGRPAWDCVNTYIAAGYTPDPMQLTATVASAAPGDIATVTATATTTSLEDDISDNTAQSTVAIVEPATVRGTVWLDADRDGVRDAEESGVTNSGLQVSVHSDSTGHNRVSASVNADGTFTAQIRPGGVVADFYLRKPYCFTPTADAPLASYDNSSPYESRAWTNPVTVTAGGEAVVNAAVVTC